MITWTTARLVDHQRVCSSQTSSSSTISSTAVASDFGSTTSRGTTEGFTTYTSQSGGTLNATLSSSSSSSSSSFSSSFSRTSVTVIFPPGVRSTSFSTSSSQSGSAQGSTLATTGRVTTETATLGPFNATTTSSSTVSRTAFTTTYNTDNSLPVITSTSTESSTFFTVTQDSTRTTTNVVQSGTTSGNARDTIYMAEPSEVLMIVNQNPAYSAPLTNNAVTATRFTVSQNVEVVALFQQPATSTLVAGTTSALTRTLTTSSFASSTRTIDASPGRMGRSTTQQFTLATTATTSTTYHAALIGGVGHRGNTVAATFTTQTLVPATLSGVEGSVQWSSVNFAVGTSATIRTIDNTINATSCSGDTTITSPILAGLPAISPVQPMMTIYGPRGAIIGNQVGRNFTGEGINAPVGTVTNKSILTALYGESTGVITPLPTTMTSVTINSDSFTYSTTTSGDTSETTVSGTFGVEGETWTQSLRSRSNLVGGDLGEGETGHIRIRRGLYKNQSGGTSFFSGNDTTYQGTRNTSYWYPISHLEPLVTNGRSVIVLPRNASTWPTFSNMP